MRTPAHLPEFQCWKKRPLVPEGILIHFISASRDHADDPYRFPYILEIFERGGYSCHELILRNGDIKELVPIKYQSWHAGVSQFKQHKNLNKNFIGIEVAGQYNDDFADAQYTSLAESINFYMHQYNIPSDMIKGHEDVSGPKVRKDYKVDPGPRMDWLRLGRLIEKLNTGLS